MSNELPNFQQPNLNFAGQIRPNFNPGTSAPPIGAYPNNPYLAAHQSGLYGQPAFSTAHPSNPSLASSNIPTSNAPGPPNMQYFQGGNPMFPYNMPGNVGTLNFPNHMAPNVNGNPNAGATGMGGVSNPGLPLMGPNAGLNIGMMNNPNQAGLGGFSQLGYHSGAQMARPPSHHQQQHQQQQHQQQQHQQQQHQQQQQQHQHQPPPPQPPIPTSSSINAHGLQAESPATLQPPSADGGPSQPHHPTPTARSNTQTSFTPQQLQMMNLPPSEQQNILDLQQKNQLNGESINILNQLWDSTVAKQQQANGSKPPNSAANAIKLSNPNATPNYSAGKGVHPSPGGLNLHSMGPPNPGQSFVNQAQFQAAAMASGMGGRPPFNPWFQMAQSMTPQQQKTLMNNMIQSQQLQQKQFQAMQRYPQNPHHFQQFQVPQQRPPGVMMNIGPGQLPPGQINQGGGTPQPPGTAIKRQSSNPAPIQPRPAANPMGMVGQPPGPSPIARLTPNPGSMGAAASSPLSSRASSVVGAAGSNATKLSLNRKITSPLHAGVGQFQVVSSSTAPSPNPLATPNDHAMGMQSMFLANGSGGYLAHAASPPAPSPKSKSNRKRTSSGRLAQASPTTPGHPPSTPATPTPGASGQDMRRLSTNPNPTSLAATLISELHSPTPLPPDVQAKLMSQINIAHVPPGDTSARSIVATPSRLTFHNESPVGQPSAGRFAINGSNATLSGPNAKGAVSQEPSLPARPVASALPPKPTGSPVDTVSLPSQKRKMYEDSVTHYQQDKETLDRAFVQQAQASKNRLIQGHQQLELQRMMVGDRYVFPGIKPLPSWEALMSYPHPLVQVQSSSRPNRLRKRPVPCSSREQLYAQAQIDERLVPIRIELESDGHRLRDTFTWNLNDTLISHELFAETLCEDLQLPSTLFVPGMVKQMKEQIADYQGHSYLSQAESHSDILFPDVKVKSESTAQGIHPSSSSGNGPRLATNDLRVVIRIDITVGNVALMDQFEWDVGRNIIAEAYKIKQNLMETEAESNSTGPGPSRTQWDILIAECEAAAQPRSTNPPSCTRCKCPSDSQTPIPTPSSSIPEDSNGVLNSAPGPTAPDLGYGLFHIAFNPGPPGATNLCTCPTNDSHAPLKSTSTPDAPMDTSQDGGHQLREFNRQIWELGQGCQDPEHFAASFCADLGLSGEFLTAVAHSIREQLFIYTKSLLLLGYPFDGSLVEDLDLQGAFLPPISTVVRSSREVNEFTPSLVELSALELERKEKDDDRDIRRKRRQTRGRRGILLPDREPLKTTRTLWRFNYNAVMSRPSYNEDSLPEDGRGATQGSAPGLPRSLFAGHEIVEVPELPPVPATPTVTSTVSGTAGMAGPPASGHPGLGGAASSHPPLTPSLPPSAETFQPIGMGMKRSASSSFGTSSQMTPLPLQVPVKSEIICNTGYSLPPPPSRIPASAPFVSHPPGIGVAAAVVATTTAATRPAAMMSSFPSSEHTMASGRRPTLSMSATEHGPRTMVSHPPTMFSSGIVHSLPPASSPVVPAHPVATTGSGHDNFRPFQHYQGRPPMHYSQPSHSPTTLTPMNLSAASTSVSSAPSVTATQIQAASHIHHQSPLPPYSPEIAKSTQRRPSDLPSLADSLSFDDSEFDLSDGDL
ncbi:SWI/SNF chromatin-remodeling complex subunit [Dimargaris cristalligena]|nr:SWI/SNF chromatin-remodeling complex subunit [Dimargaris cristalligena]